MRVDAVRVVAALRAATGRFRASDSAATAVEYGLIVSFIAVAIIAGGMLLGDSLNARFQYFADLFSNQ
jgi:pilus assembly protein Flp/PilA